MCTGKIGKDEYKDKIDKIVEFLNGKNKPMLDMLIGKMNAAAESLDFENAAKYRDQITAVKAISEMQRVVILGAGDMDMVLVLRGADQTLCSCVFCTRRKAFRQREFSDAGG